MIAFRRVLLAGIATLMFAGACTSITIPNSSIPPINIPSIPPINIPGFTIPPIVIPSGIVIPPGAFGSADPNSGVCLYVSPAEMSTIMGGQVTVTDNSGDSCTYMLANFATINVKTDTGDLSGAQFLFGNTAKSVQIGNDQGLTGVFMGQPMVYVQRGGNQLQVLGILTGSDDATMAKLVQVATLADSRWH